jgi:NH3-dependent NAD+ synthetase
MNIGLKMIDLKADFAPVAQAKHDANNIVSNGGVKSTAAATLSVPETGETGKVQAAIVAAIIAYTNQSELDDCIKQLKLIGPSIAWKSAGINQVMQARF